MRRDLDEAIDVFDVLSEAMLLRLPASGRAASDLRMALGDYRVDIESMVEGETIGSELLTCFELARTSGATLDTFDDVRVAMLAEQPIYNLATALKLSAIVFSLVEQCQVIAAMTFVSRDDVQAMIDRMLLVLDVIKLDTAELLDGMNYQNVIMLSASLIQHLAATERKLPEVVNYNYHSNLPSLYLSQRIYWTGSRSDEIADENKTIHPAFTQMNFRALSF